MRAFISIPLASLFVFLAAFNVWIMLTGRGATPRSRKLWTQAHRIAGYTFIALFMIFCYFMLLRIRGADELSPRIMLHMGLALLLGLSGLLLYLPFYVGFESQASGFVPNLNNPTRLSQWFVMFGPFAILLTIFLARLDNQRGEGAGGSQD